MATTPPPIDPTVGRERAEDRSLASLFSELTRDLSALVRQELALAQAEIGEKVSQVGSGIASLAAGGMIILTGLFFLVQALVFGVAAILALFLSDETASWLAPLIVGLIAILIGWSLLSKGRSNLKARNLALSRTAESLHRDREFAGEQVERIRHEAAAATTPASAPRNETTRKEAAQ